MIALDAMGGDYAPQVTVEGALAAARIGIHIGLFGDENQLIMLLEKADSQWSSYPISLFHCSETISMAEEPTRSIMKKKDASLVRALQAVADGQACAAVSAGNSGAALAGGIFILGRSEGIIRPAIGNFLPTTKDSIFCIDLGANADCKPEYLEQFALMGCQYVRQIKDIKNPRVALLSNGAEPYKGNELIKESYERLTKLPINFIGNLEPRYIFDDHADVLVSDGFSGNIMLKAVQGAAQAMSSWIKDEARKLPWYRKLLFAAGKSVFTTLKNKTSYAQRGGALLLGIKQPLIIAHGCSSAEAIERALLFAHAKVKEDFIPIFNRELGQALQRAGSALTPRKFIQNQL